MAGLNGRQIKKGDVVHDVINGAGRVVDDGGGVLNITVDFGTNGRMNFTQEGKFHGKQRLFWAPLPTIQARGPNDEPYEKAMEMAQLIYAHLLSYETRQNDGK